MKRPLSTLLLLLAGIAARAVTIVNGTIDEPSKLVLGVYSNANGSNVLIRQVGPKTRVYAPGSFSFSWDGLDNNSNSCAAGNYFFKVLSDNCEAIWDGQIGNTGSTQFGQTTPRGFFTIHDIVCGGNGADWFVDNGYGEANSPYSEFLSGNPSNWTNKWGPWGNGGGGLGTAGIDDKNWTFACADSNNVWFAATLGQSGNPGFFNCFAISSTMHLVVPQYPLTNGHSIVCNAHTITNGIYVGSDTSLGITGGSVQWYSSNLVYSVSNDNKIYCYDKLSGHTNFSQAMNGPGPCSFGSTNQLFVACAGTTLVMLTNFNGGSTPIGTNWTVTGFSHIVGVAVCKTNDNLILVADGGANQQIFAYNAAGTLLWTYGLNGGYPANGPTVATNKFYFIFDDEFPAGASTGTTAFLQGSFIGFGFDGTFWVGDGGCHRAMHFQTVGTSPPTYIEQIQMQPKSYNVAVDENNPVRVFNQNLEFYVDPTQPLSNAWKLVNCWTPNVNNNTWIDQGGNIGIHQVVTLSNGHTYCLYKQSGSTGNGQYCICELVTNSGIRFTSIYPFNNASSGSWVSFDTNGNLLGTKSLGSPGGPAQWYYQPITGFDGAPNPAYGTSNLIAQATAAVTDPFPACCGDGDESVRFAVYYDGGVLRTNIISFNQYTSSSGYWHLGGVWWGGTNYNFSSASTNLLVGTGTYPINVGYGGNTAAVAGPNVFFGYNGEFFLGQSEACQLMHYYPDGLFVGQYGMSWYNHYLYEQPLPGEDGNMHSLVSQTINGEVYLWVNDEGANGPARYHILNTRQIREQSGYGALGGTITLTNPPQLFPTACTVSNSSGCAALTWGAVNGAASYDLWYSTNNGGPWSIKATNAASTNILVTGLNNGSTYYFVVEAVSNSIDLTPSEQLEVHPFDTNQYVLAVGSLYEGGQTLNADILSNGSLTISQSTWLDTAQPTGPMNSREISYLGYGKLWQSFPLGGDGYLIPDYTGPGVLAATNVNSNFVITNGSGWSDGQFGMLKGVVNGTTGDTSGSAPHFWTASSLGQIGIHVKDFKWHVLTTVWEPTFNNAENFVATVTSTNATTASYTINEVNGFKHTLQYLFRGDTTLSMTPGTGNSGGLAMFTLDDVQVASSGGGGGGGGGGGLSLIGPVFGR